MSALLPEITLLWHPDCAAGEPLAKRIHAWLRPGGGLGPEVFYRSLPAPGAPPGGLPPLLPGERRPGCGEPPANAPRWQIVVALLDAHMIADAAWRHWLASLMRTPGIGTRDLLPVALDETAYNVPEALRELNFLRPSPGIGGDIDAQARSLLKQLTETLCRMLLTRFGQGQGAAPGTEPPKVTIFLSHAKADGTLPARRIRDYIYGKTQLAAFFDDNDIPYGSGFSQVLERALDGPNTAALIAVRSAKYALRPWCRREISLFRRPRPDAHPDRQAAHWHLSPVLIVDALESGSTTAGVPEFGNAPLIRWSDTIPEPEEEIVTMVLRDALLAAFHRGQGLTMPDAPDAIVLDWVPDPSTLLHVLAGRPPGQNAKVYYPGRGLTGLELEILDELFPLLTFCSFDRTEP